jgi:hypothetical protein
MKKSELQQIIREEISKALNEGSYTERMDDPTRKVYYKYSKELKLENWDEKHNELKNDPEYLALQPNMKRLLHSALSALYTQLARMER